MLCPYCGKYFSEEWHKMRSIPQCRYYFGCLVRPISEELGYDVERTHKFLKEKFLFEILYIKNKDDTVSETRITKSTTEITTKEAEQFYEDIRQWAAMYRGMNLPEPNEEQ